MTLDHNRLMNNISGASALVSGKMIPATNSDLLR
jgi:hypothetical protein